MLKSKAMTKSPPTSSGSREIQKERVRRNNYCIQQSLPWQPEFQEQTLCCQVKINDVANSAVLCMTVTRDLVNQSNGYGMTG